MGKDENIKYIVHMIITYIKGNLRIKAVWEEGVERYLNLQ